MSHNLKSNSQYAIVNCRLAIAADCPETIADNLTASFGHLISDDVIADYELANTDSPVLVHTHSTVSEGDAFNAIDHTKFSAGELAVCAAAIYQFELWSTNEGNHDSALITEQNELEALDKKLREMANTLSGMEKHFSLDNEASRLCQFKPNLTNSELVTCHHAMMELIVSIEHESVKTLSDGDTRVAEILKDREALNRIKRKLAATQAQQKNTITPPKKYRVIHDDVEKEIIVITEDGGVACIREADDISESEPRISVTDYYLINLNHVPQDDKENLWDNLGLGEIYHNDWPDTPYHAQVAIDDAINWLSPYHQAWERCDDLFPHLFDTPDNAKA